MKSKLLFILLGILSTAVFSQTSIPAGVDETRYKYCMERGLGSGRSHATPQDYCTQWAGPDHDSRPRHEDPRHEGKIPCGFNVQTQEPFYTTAQQCEAILKANAAAAAEQHQRYLAYQDCMKVLDMGPGASMEFRSSVCQTRSGFWLSPIARP